jgi:hypothetical protein
MTVAEWIRRKYKAWQIETGRVPRGRTLPSVPTNNKCMTQEELQNAFVFGGANLVPKTMLSARVFRVATQEWEDIGILSVNNKFTTAARDALVDAFTNTFEVELFNFHDAGTGTNAEANTDTTLQTAWGGARVSGTQSQPTSDVYRTVAQITFTGTFAITEHGIFSASSGGTLLDRTVFSAINVVNNDKIEFTFNLTIAAEA